MHDAFRRHFAAALVASALLCACVLSASPAQDTHDNAPPSLQITSPLGRTGLGGALRIVAQLHGTPRTALSPVQFFVDGKLVGTATSGPPFAVEWVDENPFETREIVAQAEDAEGHVLRDSVVLPSFEIEDTTDVSSVVLDVGVYDKVGRFVAKLPQSAFKVSENGIPQPVDVVTPETDPATLVLLVDNSQSMSRRMEFVRLAAGRLAASLGPKDKVVVAPFTKHVGAITGPTADRQTIERGIDAMQSQGGTAIFDSLLDSIKLVNGVEGRRAVVLITDGYDENSTSTAQAVLDAAAQADVTIYVVGIGGVAGISLKGEEALRSLADHTGGRVFFPPREPDLVPVSEAVAADAHGRYLVAYTPQNRKKDGTWRAISVDVPAGYRVRTRAGYFAPKPPPIRPDIEFTVTNSEHKYVNVTVQDIELLEDGAKQSIDTFQEAVDPVSIVMALDASGSMKKSADAVRDAARSFVKSVRPEDKLAMMTFADKPQMVHALATNRDWSVDAIDRYQADGGTALYDALWDALTAVQNERGRRAIVVLTDGRDEDNPGTAPGSTHTLDEVLELNRRVGATIFGIGLGTNVDRKVLERLAADTGGEAYFPSTGGELSGEYDRVVENLRRRYVVSYTSTNGEHDGSWRAVSVTVDQPGAVVNTRGGYFAPDE